MANRVGTRERWRRLLKRQASSGLSVAEFCRQEDVSGASFYQWRKRLESEESSPDSFVPLSVVKGQAVEIELPCGAVVRMPDGDAQALEQIVSLLMGWEADR